VRCNWSAINTAATKPVVQRRTLLFIPCLGNDSSITIEECILVVDVFVTQTMIQETWLPSRCLAMDGRSDSNIPVFSRTSQYYFVIHISGWLQGNVNKFNEQVSVAVTLAIFFSKGTGFESQPYTIYTVEFCDLSQQFPANSGIVPSNGHNCRLPARPWRAQ
jgi:hypothetical protein